MSKLSKLNKKVQNRVIKAEFPGIEGFVVTFNYISKEKLLEIRNECMTFTFNKKTKEKEDTLDTDKFTEMYVSSAINGWTGLKVKHLPELLVVDISDEDLEEAVAYTPEDALALALDSTVFDIFLTETMNDYEQFSIVKKETDAKNLESSSGNSSKAE